MAVFAYFRVSTQKQGRSGLGLDAQRAAVNAFAAAQGLSVQGEFVEVESGRKSDLERPQLAAALSACKRHRTALVVAKLDRLARDTRLILSLVDSGVRVRFVDFPDIPDGAAGRFLLTQLAAVAEFERRLISERTKAALAAAKARGVALGVAGYVNLKPNIAARRQASIAFATRLSPLLLSMQAEGLSKKEQVERLNEMGVPAARGGRWSRMQLHRVLQTIGQART